MSLMYVAVSCVCFSFIIVDFYGIFLLVNSVFSNILPVLTSVGELIVFILYLIIVYETAKQ
jgi:hypothetical protein